jgi:perosamine synthetase
MCLTNNEELAQKMRIFRDHGMNPQKRYWHDVIGFNYRMTNLQAALGVAQLKKVDILINKKRRIANEYNRHLKDIPNVTLPPEMPWAKNVYWLYSILIKASIRNKVIEKLEKQGIESRPFFYPTHLMPPHKTNLSLPIAEELSAKGLNLPSGTMLSENQIEEVVRSLKKTLNA